MTGKGTIRVEIAPVHRACRIVVADAGPVIPEDIHGTGLGLPTAKRFIEAHDGQISIDCPPDGGTVVQVTLPLHAA
jgi:signal transduction histidine kinase